MTFQTPPKTMKTFSHQAITATCSLLSLAALVTEAQAGTVNWGGAFFTSNYNHSGTALQESDTVTTVGGTVQFELGIFESGGSEFTPTYENRDQWASNWVSLGGLDGASDYDSQGQDYFGDRVIFGEGSGQVSTSGQSYVGYQAYIWGYDSQAFDPTGANAPEWFLITGLGGDTSPSTDTWLVPDTTAQGIDDLDVQWDTASASTAIIGRIDDTINGNGRMLITPALGTSDIQFAAAIPEPSSLTLLLVSSLGLLRRRR